MIGRSCLATFDGAALISDLFHKHENLVDTGDVLLNLRQIMLQNSGLDAFSRLETLSDACILVSDVAVNHALDCFNFLKAVVKAHDLTD